MDSKLQRDNFRKIVAKVLDAKIVNLFLLKLSRINGIKKRGEYDFFLQKVYQKVKPKKEFLFPSSVLTAEQIKHTVETLNGEGVAILDYHLSNEDISDITTFLYSTPAYGSNSSKKSIVTEKSIPNDEFRYNWRMNDIIQNKTIQRMLADPAFHAIAQEYIGCTPTLCDISIWLSPIYGEVTPDHVFHYDNDGPKFLKFFIYLSDSDENSGAHVYIKKTNNSSLRKEFVPSKRYSDEELTAHFGQENVVTLSAKAGTIIAEDTSGFHRGTLPRKKHRLMLQFRYCNMDTFQRKKKEKIKRLTNVTIDQHIKRITRRICR